MNDFCGSAMTENGECKETEIFEQLGRLDESVKYLADKLKSLTNRLEPIQTPRIASQVKPEELAEKSISQVAKRVKDIRIEVEKLQVSVNNALSSLEI